MSTSQATALTEAMEHEQAIADEAAAIRNGDGLLTRELFLKLWPLLRKPIPAGFIKSLGKLEGKPYASTGVSAVQVQIERMDNVLGPLSWEDKVEYSEEGKLAHVTVNVVDENGEVLVSRESWGGVNRGSTTGNLYKGSYTNAAKVAFARVGPGHEVYMGATDFDPDTDEDSAKVQAQQPARASGAGQGAKKITKTRAEGLVKAATRAGVLDKLQLAAAHVHGDDVGACSTEAEAVKALVNLSVDEADRVKEWIDRKAAEAMG